MNRANLPVILNHYYSKAETEKKYFYEQISRLNKKKEELEQSLKLTTDPVQEILSGRDPLEIAAEEHYNETATLAMNLLDLAIEKMQEEITAAGVPVQQKISLIQTAFSALANQKSIICSRVALGDPVTPWQKNSYEAQRNALMVLIRDMPKDLLFPIVEDIDAITEQPKLMTAVIAA